jgi:hypothetical protein
MAASNDMPGIWVPPLEVWEPDLVAVPSDPYSPDPYFPDPYA